MSLCQMVCFYLQFRSEPLIFKNGIKSTMTLSRTLISGRRSTFLRLDMMSISLLGCFQLFSSV